MENGEYESEDEQLNSTTPLEEHVELPAKGDLLVAMRTLSIQSNTEEQEQRDNLFHTRCHALGKFCILIIDGGNCTNVVGKTIIKKLGLKVM